MPTLQVAAGLVVNNGLILLARRGPGEQLAGLWEFPGGKVEPGEAPENAVVRELYEELDLLVTVDELCMKSRTGGAGSAPIELLVYWARAQTQRVSLRVHDASAWVERGMLGEYDVAPADTPVVQHLCSGPKVGETEAENSSGGVVRDMTS